MIIAIVSLAVLGSMMYCQVGGMIHHEQNGQCEGTSIVLSIMHEQNATYTKSIYNAQ